MKIKLTSLYLTDYDKKDKKKKHFMDQLKNDTKIELFVAKDIEEKFDKIKLYKNNDRMHVGPAYIVTDQNKPIGFVRMSCFNAGVIYLHYGVISDYRNKGYGTKILTETGNYIFRNFGDVEQIALNIRTINEASAKAATKANYKYDSSVNTENRLYQVDTYIKRR